MVYSEDTLVDQHGFVLEAEGDHCFPYHVVYLGHLSVGVGRTHESKVREGRKEDEGRQKWREELEGEG